MAQDPTNNQTGGNTAFSQQAGGSQTNPFAGDMRGEFTSDFGTNTNAVSQIFKTSGFGGEDRNKMILIGVAVLAIAGGAFYYFTSADSADPFAGAEAPPGEVAKEAGGEGVAEEGATSDEKPAEEGATAASAEGASAAKNEPVAKAPPQESAASSSASSASMSQAAAPAATGSIALGSPSDGAAQAYDESHGPAMFEWEGAADKIIFSRSASMQPIVKSVNLAGKSSYAFANPYPGTWFWKVENSSGASEVRRFVVESPVPRTFPVSAPQAGGTLAGTGGVVSWQAGQQIASYRVELFPAGRGFANPAHRFGTSGNTVTLQNVAPGSYDLRVGAFSEVAGRWEYQVIAGVTVQ